MFPYISIWNVCIVDFINGHMPMMKSEDKKIYEKLQKIIEAIKTNDDTYNTKLDMKLKIFHKYADKYR